MPYASRHMLLAWTGVFTSGSPGSFVTEDSFSGSLRFVGTAIEESQNDETLDALVAVITAYWQDSLTYIPQRAVLDVVKWNLIGTDGRYASRTETRQSDVLGINGTASMRFPPQIAWATTWTTEAARGRASKGRTFWPTGIPLDVSTFRPNQDAIVQKVERDLGLIRDLNDAASTSGQVTLRAAVMSNLGSGTTGLITGARIGDRVDVQRRRAEQMGERYTAAQGTVGP